MELYLNNDLIKTFIEKYGDGDVYYSHKRLDDGRIKVKYFPSLTLFVSDENIPHLFEELKESPHLEPKYVREIILNDKIAYVIDDNGKKIKNALTKNYAKFLEDVKNKKFEKPVKEHKPKTQKVEEKPTKKYSKKKNAYNRSKTKNPSKYERNY